MARRGHKHISILSPTFSSDCVEMLEEIKEEIHDSFMGA
ncbi:hypothetical protein [Halomonas sp. G11]|nr:hypothetical protein [Halomonas sp. G11]